MEQIGHESFVNLKPTKYIGYTRPSMGKVRVVGSSPVSVYCLGIMRATFGPRVRFYVQRTPGRSRMFCSPIMRFCLRPDHPQELAVQTDLSGTCWSTCCWWNLSTSMTRHRGKALAWLSHREDLSSLNLASTSDARGCMRSR